MSGLFALSPREALGLAAERGTPCFAYRLDLAERRFLELRRVLPARVRLAYAVKANPHPALVARFASLGASFDCASGGELERLRAAEVPGGRLLFAGPGKAPDELAQALALGARIQVDGIEDLERLERLLDGYRASRPAPSAGSPRADGEPLGVNLRVHPAAGVVEGADGAGAIIGGTGPSAFGVDEERLPEFLAVARGFRRVRISGLQVFAASNERDAGRLLANHEAALSIAERMTRQHGLELECVDVGGGLGIPYSEDEPPLDIELLGRGLAALLEARPWFRGELVLEPGRWLAGPVGVYLSRVLRVKESRGKLFAVLEGGVNHLLRPLLTGQAFPTLAPGASGESTAQILAGPLCTSLDRLGEAVLPRLRPGDLVMFGQAGAYGYTEAMGDFLSHPRPAEHCLEGPPIGG